MVVEDDEIFAEQLADVVRQSDDFWVAATARTFAEGARALHKWTPDLLLTDVGLPDGSGLGLIQMARKKRLANNVLVLSVFGETRLVLRCLKAGANGYLLKSDGGAEVGKQLSYLRSGGRPISPMIASGVLDHFMPRPTADDEPAIKLSPREREVLNFIAKGCSYEEIASLLQLKPNTVETFVKRAFKKLRVHNKAEAIFEFGQLGLDLDDEP